MSHFKNCKIFIPGSENEFKKLFLQNYKKKQINYFRLPDKNHNFRIEYNKINSGKGIKINNGRDVTIVVTGYLLKHVLDVLPVLKKKKIFPDILYFNTLKPFDSKIVRESVRKTKNILTIEELSAHDGLHNLCIKACVGTNIKNIKQLAIKDFIHEYGTLDDLYIFVKLDKNSILNEILKFF